MKVHLIDGTYELFRMFYAAPSRETRDGREVAASRSFARSMIGLLGQEDVSHVAIAFDHVIESFRNELFDGYKNGEGIDPRLWSQAPVVEEVTRTLGIVVWPMVDFEADDAMAAGAARYARHPEVDQVVLGSPDKDMAQCVKGNQVVLWDRRRELIYDEEGVFEKWGVRPSSIPDLLALVGDDADGIPGIPRWGMKSSATLLAHYGSFEAIPSNPDEWEVKVRGAAALSSNLEQHREEVALYKVLATLREDVPLAEDLDALEWKGPDRARISKLAELLEDEDLGERLESLAES